MEFTLDDKMRAIFNSGNVVKIEKVLRTKSGEKHYKYIWTVDGTSVINTSNISAPTGADATDPTATNRFTCNGSIDNLTYFRFTTGAAGTVTAVLNEVSCWSNVGIQIALFRPTTPCSSPANWGVNLRSN